MIDISYFNEGIGRVKRVIADISAESLDRPNVIEALSAITLPLTKKEFFKFLEPIQDWRYQSVLMELYMHIHEYEKIN